MENPCQQWPWDGISEAEILPESVLEHVRFASRKNHPNAPVVHKRLGDLYRDIKRSTKGLFTNLKKTIGIVTARILVIFNLNKETLGPEISNKLINKNC